jgi:hypothetical protein
VIFRVLAERVGEGRLAPPLAVTIEALQ